MSGVNALRAMFEQRKAAEASSPPDQQRGRTPAPDSSEPPRPLSRIRTSFIAVEKDGRIGLHRDTSRGDSRESTTRSISGEKSVGTPLTEISNTFDTAMADTPPKTSLLNEPIPESPHPDAGAGAGASAPAANPVAAPKVEAPKAEAASGSPVRSAGIGAVAGGPVDAKPPAAAPSANGKSAGSANGQPKGAAPRARVPISKTTKPAPVAAKVVPKIDLTKATTSTTTTTLKPTKSSAATSAPKTPTDTVAAAAKPSLKTPDRRSGIPQAGKPSSVTSAPRGRTMASASANASREPSAVKKPANITTTTTNTTFSPSFIKPKVKSPTKPVKLPAGLTMQTAASEQRRSQSRSTTRAPSRATELPAAKKTTLKRQSSNINRPVPSLGPPPKLSAKDHPPTRKESEHVDEAFLERMMRPTTASSSKVHEKVLTPPRKQPASASGSKQTTPQPVKKIAPLVLAPAPGPSKAATAATTPSIIASSTKPSASSSIATAEPEKQSPAPAAAAGPVEPIPTAVEPVELSKPVEATHEDERAPSAAEPFIPETKAQETAAAADADEHTRDTKGAGEAIFSEESDGSKSSEGEEHAPETEQHPIPAAAVAV